MGLIDPYTEVTTMRKFLSGLLALAVLMALGWAALWAQEPMVGGQVVYGAQQGGTSVIYLTQVEMPTPRLMTQGSDPSLCPAGQRIVFVRDANIMCMPASGGEARVIARHGLGVQIATPSPRPDASGVVFALAPVVPNPVWGIFTVNNDGSGERKVIDNGTDPAMSPDAQWIAFARGGDIYRVRPNGTQLTQLTKHGPNATASSPSYSPDGSRIAYALKTAAPAAADLHIMRADGSNDETLLTGGAQPDFSPDGQWLVYLSGNNVAIASTDGARQRTLVPNVSRADHPVWGPLPRP